MGINVINKMFDLETTILNFESFDSDDFLDKISDILYEKGYVKGSFKSAILNREHEYPTGLPTKGIKVAMPHTDIEHALKPTIAVIKFAHPVPFKEMGNGINIVNADLAFVLVVTELKSQVDTLQTLMELFCNEDSLKRIYLSNTKESLYNAVLSELIW